jgi:alginate O-acetyltransferase complex protein AlgI
VRYHDISGQLVTRELSTDKMLSGIWRFCRGLARKVLIANVLGEVADHAFAMGADRLCFTEAWVGAVCYAFQIYFDFAGYSDMAVGLGRMLGFEFLENFNRPYISRDFMEFWKRWHISLSTWMREYLYIPLGGNRVSRGRMYLNLWVVFMLSGLWHGASWNFLVWGCYHGVFICLSRMLGNDRLRRIPGACTIPVTFLLVTIGWVFFRAGTLSRAMLYLGRMFPVCGTASVPAVPVARILDAHAGSILLLAAGLSFAPAFSGMCERTVASWRSRGGARWLPQFISALGLLFLSVCALAAGRFNPFIYFRF